MSIYFNRTEGSYDWCHPSDKQACLFIGGLPETAPARQISETTEIGGQFDYDGDDIWEMLDCIEAAEKRWTISSGRSKKLEVIKWMRDNRLTLEVEMQKARAIRLQKVAAKAAEAARSAYDTLIYAQDELYESTLTAPLTDKQVEVKA